MGDEDKRSVNSGRIFQGSLLASDLIGPTIIGVFLDWQFGWKPVATLIGLGVGLVAFTYHLVLIARRLSRDDPPSSDRGES